MNAANNALHDFRETLSRLGSSVVREDLSDDERIKRVKNAFMRNLDGHKAVDLDTCLQCGMCAEACHFYEVTRDEKYAPVYKFRLLRRFYRREVSPMRWLYKPFTRDIGAQDLDEWQHYVYDACTGCGRCDMICPMGINISTLINVVREGLASAGCVPAELEEMQQVQARDNTVYGVDAAKLGATLDGLRADGIDVPLDKDEADILLLTTAVEVLVFPGALAANATILNKSGVDWTLRSDAFEASNFGLISGNEKTRNAAIGRIVDAAEACGAKTVLIPESGHGYQQLRWGAADVLGRPLSFDVLSMPEFILQAIAEGRLQVNASNGTSVTYHDPCRLARKGGVMQQPREVLEAAGFELRETETFGRENFCCGGGCGEYVLGASSELRQKVFQLKKDQFDDAGADAVVTGCANCRLNLQIGADNAEWHKPIRSFAEAVADRLAN